MKKVIIALLLAVAIVLTFIACSTDGSGENKEGDSETTTTTTKVRTDVPDPISDDDDDDDDDDEEIVDLFIKYGTAVIDGEKDAAWDDAQTVELDVVKIDKRTDAVVTAAAMWDENAFYFYIDVKDSNIVQAGDVGDWRNDSFYLYVGEDMEYADTVTASGQFANGVFQFALINEDLDMLPRYGEEVESQVAYKTTSDGFVIEFCYTPTAELKDDVLTAGHLIYLDYQYNDCSTTGARDGALGFYNASDTNFTPTLWAYAKLLAQGEAIPAAE